MDDWNDPQDRPPPVDVPYVQLSADALRGVVEAFVLREGTDYGVRDVPHEDKVAQVMRQLERGRLGSCSIRLARVWISSLKTS